MNAETVPHQFITIQYLRGIAALCVVYLHALCNQMTMRYADYGIAGAWGVDIFFVISGFIIWTSSRSSVSSIKYFLLKRFSRIYPLYWICLTTWIAARLIVPDRLASADLSVKSVFSSYLLLPHLHLVYMNRVWPILIPGWTLQIELWFYAVFAITLALIKRLKVDSNDPLTLVTILSLLSIAGSVCIFENPILRVYTSPLLLEFVAGILIAHLLPQIRGAPWWVGLIAIIVGPIIACRIGTEIPELIRSLTYGVAATVTVAGALILETVARRRPVAIMKKIGDASYSLYVTHPMTLGAMAVLWRAFHLPSNSQFILIGFVPLSIALAILGALLCYRFVETPLLTFTRQALSPNHIAPIGSTSEAHRGG